MQTIDVPFSFDGSAGVGGGGGGGGRGGYDRFVMEGQEAGVAVKISANDRDIFAELLC